MLQYRALLMHVYLNNNQDFLRHNHYCRSVCTNIFILSPSRSDEWYENLSRKITQQQLSDSSSEGVENCYSYFMNAHNVARQSWKPLLSIVKLEWEFGSTMIGMKNTNPVCLGRITIKSKFGDRWHASLHQNLEYNSTIKEIEMLLLNFAWHENDCGRRNDLSPEIKPLQQ